MSKPKALTLAVIARQLATEEAAREYLEKLRWPNGPACPFCGGAEVYRLTAKPGSTKPGRKGLLKCKYCRKQFTVTVGTIFEASHIKLNHWLMAIHLLCSSKKGMSAHQLHRMLGITYKAAWFLAHRIRYAMEEGPNGAKLTGIIEADETYIGGKRKQGEWKKSGFKGAPTGHMAPVFALVQRNGEVRAWPMERVTSENLHAVLKEN